MPPAARIIALCTVLLGLSACGDGGISERAERLSCAVPSGTEAFGFDSGGYRLSGFIDAPATPAPHPAVLLLHDAGPTGVFHGRGDFPKLREAFRSAGLASVVFDRRGSGCSGGRDRGVADLYANADDVLAAVDALRARADIDAERIGLWAPGRGAYVAPMAAARSSAVAFMIVAGAPGDTYGNEAAYRVRKNLELEGVPAAEAKDIGRDVAQAMAVMAEQKPYDAFESLAEPLKRNPYMQRLWRVAPDLFPDPERYTEWQESGALDVNPRRFLPALELPVLAVWGGLDSEVDWQGSLRAYRDAFARDGDGALDTQVFDDADHSICAASTGTDSGAAEEQLDPGAECEPAPGYLDAMLAWLRGHGFAADSP
jgi:alpha-beta hydrolase superfamily lysophospholipase